MERLLFLGTVSIVSACLALLWSSWALFQYYSVGPIMFTAFGWVFAYSLACAVLAIGIGGAVASFQWVTFGGAVASFQWRSLAGVGCFIGIIAWSLHCYIWRIMWAHPF